MIEQIGLDARFIGDDIVARDLVDLIGLQRTRIERRQAETGRRRCVEQGVVGQLVVDARLPVDAAVLRRHAEDDVARRHAILDIVVGDRLAIVRIADAAVDAEPFGERMDRDVGVGRFAFRLIFVVLDTLQAEPGRFHEQMRIFVGTIVEDACGPVDERTLARQAAFHRILLVGGEVVGGLQW